MKLIIEPGGVVHAVYDETIDLSAFGSLAIRRASHCEPDESGQWWADLAPLAGPRLGPFKQRSQALAAERGWLDHNWRSPAEPARR